MKRTTTPLCLVLAPLMSVSAAIASAQESDEAVPFTLEITVTGFDGRDAVDTRTHQMQLIIDKPSPTQLRQGREIAVGDEYRNVGTNVSCRARTHAPGYLVWCTFEQSSLIPGAGVPAFNTLHLVSEVVARAGETQELGTVDVGAGKRWTVAVTLHRRD